MQIKMLTTVHIPGSWNIPVEHLCLHSCFMDISLFEVNFYRFSHRKFSSVSFPPAVAAKHYHQHATLQSDTLKKKIDKNYCLGMMWNFFTPAASCTLFCWFSSNQHLFVLKIEQILVLQQQTTTNSILLILCEKKDQLNQTFHSFLHILASPWCSLQDRGSSFASLIRLLESFGGKKAFPQCSYYSFYAVRHQKTCKIQHLLNFICVDREAFPCFGFGVCNVVYKDGKPPIFHLQNAP